MNAYFPVTDPISSDANSIMSALNSRSKQLQEEMTSQNLLKKTSLIVLKILGLTSCVLAIASIPIALIKFSATSITIPLLSACVAISSLALHTFLDPRSPNELIIRDQWRLVFDSLRKGNGAEILKNCQELERQKEKKASSFNLCLGSPVNILTPFYHKICLVGHLQLSLDHLRKNEKESAVSRAHLALSHFGPSGFSNHIKVFAQKIIDTPTNIRHLIETSQAGEDLHALDHLIFMSQSETE